MRCVDMCLLDDPAVAALSLDEFLARLRRCDGCPHAAGDDARLARLLARCRDAASSQRRLHADVRKLEHDIAELNAEAERSDREIAKLERLQQVSSEEIEAELARSVERVREQEREIEALSVPIIHVAQGVFVLPIIGALTAARAKTLTERVLDEIVRAHVGTVILDVTGVGDVDTATADHLIRMVAAMRLLGARPILTGITPDVAQTLAELGVALEGIATCRNVRQALAQLRGP